MKEEDNNIENTENMKTVVVAQDGSGDYESIERALFFEDDKQKLEIIVKEGVYLSEILIDREVETYIIGSKNCMFTEKNEDVLNVLKVTNSSVLIKNIYFFTTNEQVDFFFVESNSSIILDGCIFECKNNDSVILVERARRVVFMDCIFHLFQVATLISVSDYANMFFIRNTVIGVEDIVFLETDSVKSSIQLQHNIFFRVGDIIRVENTNKDLSEFLEVIYKEKKLIMGQNVNLIESEEFQIDYGVNIIDKNILNENNIQFKDEEIGDYRIADPRYKKFGASDETILFFMDNEESQTQPHKPNLSKKEILIYTDTSLFKKEFEDFIIHLKKESEIKNVIPIYSIEDLQKQRNISTLVLVSPADKAENEKEIFTILKEAKKLNKQIFIFLADIKKHTGDKMNIVKMPQVLETHTKLKEEENVSFYENTEQLEEIIYQRLQNSFPKVELEKLKLKNIGHFSELEIDFEKSNQNAYCFIGTNGTGKTSILRAIILGLIGTSSKALDKNELQNLVKIYGIEDENIKRENAFIELHYLLDNKKQHNKIVCEIGKDGNLQWEDEGGFVLLDEPFLESLVIAFSQLRGERGNNGNSQKEVSRQLRAHISDVLPLVYNEVDKRLGDFSRWIIDLYAKANEKEVQINRQENSTKKETEIIERTTINLVFEIVSELLDQKITFKEVRDNKEVWICTELAENGIPITLVSQGFNTIIGWIGGLLQRMQEVYGLHALSRKEEFRTYPAFCVIDELDPHLHPKVQANLMNVLKKYFPNTLFVFSTHSPLIIPYLEKENVFMLTQNGEVSNAHIHTKGRSYQNILLDFMNVSERPKEYADKLDILYRFIDDENIEEANKLLAEIIKDFGENDPEILRAQTMIDFIED